MSTALERLIAAKKAGKQTEPPQSPSASQLDYTLQEKLASLSAALDARLPMRDILRDIHTNLKADPDIVTILSEDEIAVIVAGLKKQTNTEITTTALKGSSNTSKLKKLTVSDL